MKGGQTDYQMDGSVPQESTSDAQVCHQKTQKEGNEQGNDIMLMLD